MFFKSRKKKDSDLEKRVDQRVSFFQSSYFLPVNQGSEADTFECWFSNISEGGLAFETRADKLHEGDQIKVLYKLGAQLRNDNLKIQFASRVLDKYRYGCAFMESDENRKLMINQYFKMNEDKQI